MIEYMLLPLVLQAFPPHSMQRRSMQRRSMQRRSMQRRSMQQRASNRSCSQQQDKMPLNFKENLL